MTAGTGAGLVHLELSEPAPLEAAAGGRLVVRLRASCAAGLERGGMPVRITAPDGSVTTQALASDIVLQMPASVGEEVWRFALPAHEIDGARYRESTLEVPVNVRPQATSLAVWAVPSPVVAGERFTIKVGAKSSADCALSGRRVEVRDRDGALVASGALGDTPWPGTAALHWTELELAAPPAEGLCSWSVRFEAAELALPHDGAESTFSAAVVRPPEHRLTVRVVEQGTASPVGEATVRLGAFRAETGRSGEAEIRLPKGRYQVQVWKAGYAIEPATLDLDCDASIEVTAAVVPEEDPDARWKM